MSTCGACGSENPAGSSYCSRCGKPMGAMAGSERPVPGVNLGDVLSGRYRLDAKLGEGGMGTVYAAHDVELDRPVALKLLARSMVEDAEVVERFDREARLTAKLEHPNVVPVYDVGRQDGRPFLVMKRIDGDTLAARLKEKGGLTKDETLALFRQLALGVDFIHAQGFIHRDIKAHNIMVGPTGQATLLDFGILRSQRGNDALTRTGMVMGTPHYMAPEQALGLKEVDHRVDLYALAVVLFECLTGTLPFEADSELGLIQLQAHAPPPELLQRAPWIPRAVADVVTRALSKRPLDRYPSATALVQALEHAYASEPAGGVAPAPEGERPAVAPEPRVSPATAPSWRARAEGVVESARPQPPSSAPAPVAAVEPPSSTLDLEKAAVQPSRWPWFVLGGLVVVVSGLVVAWPSGPPSVEDHVVPTRLDPGNAAEALEVDAGAAADAVGRQAPPDAGGGAVAGAGVVTVNPMHGRVGQVRIISTLSGEPYWTQVYVDGAPKGRTPLVVSLPPGRHRIRMERNGFAPQEQEIHLGRAALVVRFELKP